MRVFLPRTSIVNGGTSAVPLSELTVRYWYTIETQMPEVKTNLPTVKPSTVAPISLVVSCMLNN
jgi:hypothetical protein